jgi:hypothetical protein
MPELLRSLDAHVNLPSYAHMYALVTWATATLASGLEEDWRCCEVNILKCVYLAKQCSFRTTQLAWMNHVRQLVRLLRRNLEF